MNGSAPLAANPRRPVPGEDPEVARLKAMVVALLGEVVVLRERLDTVERLGEAKGGPARAAIEAYAPDPAAETEREVIRKRLIGKVLRQLKVDVALAAERQEEKHAAADAVLAEEIAR